MAPTCTLSGSYDYVVYCSVCDTELSRDEVTISSLGHTIEVISGYAATCTVAGLTDGKSCSVCGEILVAQEEITVLGHNYDDGVITKQPTTTETGERTYSCICGDSYVEEIPRLENEPTPTPLTSRRVFIILTSIFSALTLTGTILVLIKKRRNLRIK